MTMRSFHFGSVLLLLSISRIHGFSPTLTSKRHQRNCNAQISSRGPVYYSSLQTSLGYIDNTMDRPSDFAKRMRSNVTPTKVPKKVSPGRPNNVVEVVTLQDYKTIVADEKDQMVVVRFYAPWCRACKAVAPAFYRLAREFENIVKFVEVPVTSSSVNIHQGLGVPSIPFGHIYDPSVGLVEEMRMSRKRFPRFEETLRSYVAGSCGTPDFIYSDPYETSKLS